jgi:hypothetical protein
MQKEAFYAEVFDLRLRDQAPLEWRAHMSNLRRRRS